MAHCSTTQATAPPSAPVSRLVQALAELMAVAVELPPAQLAERLGRLFDLTQSIALSSAQRLTVGAEFEPERSPAAGLRLAFLDTRAALVRSVLRSFDRADAVGRVRVPLAAAQPPEDWSEAYAPYHRFYSAHQTDIEFRVRRQHAALRDAVAARSAQLARLCALDAALGDSLAVHARKQFAAIPRLLGWHFEQVHRQHCQAPTGEPARSDAWISSHEQFCALLQSLLLAEIEARLLPSLGLLEAIDEAI